jgi:hypothetical protein
MSNPERIQQGQPVRPRYFADFARCFMRNGRARELQYDRNRARPTSHHQFSSRN